MIPLYRFDFMRSEYEYILSECCFTDEEKEILNLRRKGKSNIEISFILCISERTVQRRIKDIAKKIQKLLIKY